MSALTVPLLTADEVTGTNRLYSLIALQTATDAFRRASAPLYGELITHIQNFELTSVVARLLLK